MFLPLQWHCESREAKIQSSDTGRGLCLLPATLQLPDPSRRTLPPVQLVSVPECVTLWAGQDRQHVYFLFKVISKHEINLLLCLWLQIRLALKDWADVKKFEKDATVAHHFDVIYILRQLMFCKAFHFTATPSLVSFLSKYFKYI